ncbi:c-type cytochrome [Alcaligenes sp. SDU_A2]|uniref:c-type cytochrome n=1 Tax=Alcaligenes sp. SDU_A2 TaxID=3136634 RepID=UPI00311FBB17
MQTIRYPRIPASRWLALALLLISAAPAGANEPLEQGKALATSGSGGVLACATCHGSQGEGNAPAGFPFLASQGASYLAEQLENLASGKRANPIMQPIAKAMTAAQIQAVSAYYAQLPAPVDKTKLGAHVDLYPAQEQLGAWIANRGDWNNNIPACIQCHGPGGAGVGESFPALAGLPAGYIRSQLQAWRDGTRDPGPLALMGEIAKRMTDAQINATADYFATLPASLNHPAVAQGSKP